MISAEVPPTEPPPPSTTEGPPEDTDSIANVTITLTPFAVLDEPLALAARPGTDDLYVAERDGRLRRISGVSGDPVLDEGAVLDFSGDVSTSAERGFLGVTFSPDGARLYVSYSDPGGDTAVDEYLMAGDDVDAASRRPVFSLDQPFGNHNGGDIHFGPDGFLYLALGDGGSSGDPNGEGQNTDTLLGTLIRIDPSGGDPYAVPADNPFTDGGGQPEVWLYGVRNPWRFSFDRVTGDLWIGDVGQNSVEEIDFLPTSEGAGAGANLGWNRLEGISVFAGSPPAEQVLPVLDYPQGPGCSVIGGYVYRGTRIPGLYGAYLYSDLCDAEIRGLLVRDGAVVEQRDFGVGSNDGEMVAFGEDQAGKLYVLSQSGEIFRIDPVEPAQAPAAADTPDGLAAQIVDAEQAVRDPETPLGDLAAAAHLQQVAYRHLAATPAWEAEVMEAIPPALRHTAATQLAARREFLGMHTTLSDTVPAWRIEAPVSAEELLGYYQEAEASYGVGWEYLAAINLVETGMGRIRGLSVAGAQGPMQFIPSTWERWGEGDVNDPRDAILAAARYLASNGAPDNMAAALRSYNNHNNYVRGVTGYASIMEADALVYYGFYHWQIHYLSAAGDLFLPVGYEELEAVPVDEYVAAHPEALGA